MIVKVIVNSGYISSRKLLNITNKPEKDQENFIISYKYAVACWEETCANECHDPSEAYEKLIPILNRHFIKAEWIEDSDGKMDDIIRVTLH